MRNQVYIALGSNLAQPIQQLNQALQAIAHLPNTQLNRVSSFYQSKPLGPQDQPDYVNAVACIITDFAPFELLEQLQKIEQQQGRIRLRRWGERTLDLDILLYDDLVLQTERLTIPHYDMQNREFVIIPLIEIAPDLILPNGKKLKDLAEKFVGHSMLLISSDTTLKPDLF
ncbi:2-amino-4-hydroxy-6-hydroxymethyldihydropteridine diphosphokinase [Volucribacter psittacicida]|uniref:2-amino-4-hydroxy-6-hydroxymethyldihydropteridine pyrophosphokinase n=1 Tax=Volucribacter psittacicida TaxID=203482 RepID=A0A4R1GC75_9PAST|nr:2-amino-4-hydroxy-6-hydroxymethyldihydropteridine diphosphokinase [Volucribacter psittacicida]TCK01912.1 2-amino-4-hydroxy-6-hydroxymethyldihydropteridine diphosphokinase [Volucribacter psittacicida]